MLIHSEESRRLSSLRRSSSLLMRAIWLPAMHLVSSTVLAIVWVLIIALHSLNALVALVAAGGHLLLSNPALYKAIRSVQIPQEALKISGWTYLVIGFLHVYEVLAMVFRSLWHRRLVFSTSSKKRLMRSERQKTAFLLNPTTQARLFRPFTRLAVIVDRCFGLDGYFGVNGQLFDLVFHSLEALEMGTQTYQAYQFSRSVSHLWIKQFAVAVIVLNGTFPALAHVFLQKNEGARRLVNIVIDLFLDFSSAVLLPVGILSCYVQAWNFKNGGFDPNLSFNDVWLTNGIAEARQVFVTSRFDYVASMMPHIGFLLCLDMVKGLLHRAPERRARRLRHTPNGSTAITLVDLCADVSEIRGFQRDQVNSIIVPSTRKKLIRHGLYYGFSVIWSIVVLAIHIQAEQRGAIAIPGCRLPLSPWLGKNASCSVMQINCYRQGQAGESALIAEPLQGLERDVVTKIIVTHCPALEIPEIFHEFSRLHTLEIFNSTLAKWPQSATFTQQHLPFLYQTCFYDKNLSTIPDGLLHDQLPDTMKILAFFRSNITELPESISEHWATHEWFTLSLEFTPLRKLPDALSKIYLQALYLTGSAIEEIPDELLSSMQLSFLRFSGSSLKRLPRSFGEPTTLRLLMVEATNITMLTPWVETWLDEAMTRKTPPSVSFYGSSLCQGGVDAKYERPASIVIASFDNQGIYGRIAATK
ncbi:hypothetical protein Poli38472_010011 [Pythium oligandrum]|uniref:Uncharacterized protein n=1 Tax=Pythium oligandrum TaxID=41045 RepID=A0A8K1C9K9_PYTOL|nr:hypothetical protein Poli38472_010011 [Pythium oligandrum]|eukprot:TMW58452.1 hypothetical protein Poli38472_010011 [Pythium oligandrum]